MPVRATDRVTLASTLSVTYARRYYLLQDSTLAPPSAPTTNPPASPWTTTEPAYTAGSTVSLYTVNLTVYGAAGFEYGPVQKDSAYEAAKQAYNAAQAAASAATVAQDTANGKNSVTYSSANASVSVPGVASGDIWYRTSGNLITAMWVWDGAQWNTRTMDSTVLTNLDAGAITTGFLTAARVAANSVSTDKLLVGSFTNLLEDPSFDASPPSGSKFSEAWTAVHSGASRVTTNTRSGSAALRFKAGTAAYNIMQQTRSLHVEPGEKYFYKVWFRAETGTAVTEALELSVQSGATEAASTTTANVARSGSGIGTTYVAVSGVWTVPAGHYYARPRLVSRGDTGNTNLYLVDDLFFQKQADGDIIATGSITGDLLSGNAVDGKVITGATIRTAASGQRLQLDASGLTAYDANGNQGARLVSANGALQLTSGFTIGTGAAGAAASSFTTSRLDWYPSTGGNGYVQFGNIPSGQNEMRIVSGSPTSGGNAAQLALTSSATFDGTLISTPGRFLATRNIETTYGALRSGYVDGGSGNGVTVDGTFYNPQIFGGANADRELHLNNKSTTPANNAKVLVGGNLNVLGEVFSQVPGSGQTTPLCPIGSGMEWYGDSLPASDQVNVNSGWMWQDGSAISRSLYPELFAIIGTKFGAGDGSTTFNLPNRAGRVPVGINPSDSDFNAVGKTGGSKTHKLLRQQSSVSLGIGSGYGPIGSGAGAGQVGISETDPNNNPFPIVQPYITVRYIIRVK